MAIGDLRLMHPFPILRDHYYQGTFCQHEPGSGELTKSWSLSSLRFMIDEMDATWWRSRSQQSNEYLSKECLGSHLVLMDLVGSEVIRGPAGSLAGQKVP